jgi:hypothetical protein
MSLIAWRIGTAGMKLTTRRILDSTMILRRPANSGNMIAAEARTRIELVAVLFESAGDLALALGAAIYPVVFVVARQ